MRQRTLFTVMALGLSVFCEGAVVGASEQAASDTHAATNDTSDGASTSVTSASDTRVSNSRPSESRASDTRGSDTRTTTAASSNAPAPVCFKLSSHCIDSRPQDNTARRPQDNTARPLNLAAPDVRSVVPVQELKEPLPTPDEQTTAEETNTVQVAGDSNTPDVPGGFGALWWAIRNPSQAWRIFAPVQ